MSEPFRRPRRWWVLAVYALVMGLSQLLWLNFAPILVMIEQRYGVSELLASQLILVFPLLYVLLSFPAANRDPEVFPDAGKVVLDRKENRHAAFGLGIHRCVGSNLARMELRVALEEWLKRIPEFRLEDPAGVTWSEGTVRGPRRLRVVLGAGKRP